MAASGKVFTGVRAKLSINGTAVGFASNVNANITHAHSPIDVLDRINPMELAPVGYTVDFSFTRYRIAADSAVKLGFQPTLLGILTSPDLIVTLEDTGHGDSGLTLLTINGVRLISTSISVDARGVASNTFNFQGIEAFDENGPGRSA